MVADPTRGAHTKAADVLGPGQHRGRPTVPVLRTTPLSRPSQELTA
ncbi:hypothetical protein ACFVW2_01025 [Streptomyces sp. NPDC058171]